MSITACGEMNKFPSQLDGLLLFGTTLNGSDDEHGDEHEARVKAQLRGTWVDPHEGYCTPADFFAYENADTDEDGDDCEAEGSDPLDILISREERFVRESTEDFVFRFGDGGEFNSNDDESLQYAGVAAEGIAISFVGSSAKKVYNKTERVRHNQHFTMGNYRKVCRESNHRNKDAKKRSRRSTIRGGVLIDDGVDVMSFPGVPEAYITYHGDLQFSLRHAR